MKDGWPVVLRRAVMAFVPTCAIATILVAIESAFGIGYWPRLLLNQIPIMVVWRRAWDWSALPAPSEPSR